MKHLLNATVVLVMMVVLTGCGQIASEPESPMLPQIHITSELATEPAVNARIEGGQFQEIRCAVASTNTIPAKEAADRVEAVGTRGQPGYVAEQPAVTAAPEIRNFGGHCTYVNSQQGLAAASSLQIGVLVLLFLMTAILGWVAWSLRALKADREAKVSGSSTQADVDTAAESNRKINFDTLNKKYDDSSPVSASATAQHEAAPAQMATSKAVRAHPAVDSELNYAQLASDPVQQVVPNASPSPRQDDVFNRLAQLVSSTQLTLDEYQSSVDSLGQRSFIKLGSGGAVSLQSESGGSCPNVVAVRVSASGETVVVPDPDFIANARLIYKEAPSVPADVQFFYDIIVGGGDSLRLIKNAMLIDDGRGGYSVHKGRLGGFRP